MGYGSSRSWWDRGGPAATGVRSFFLPQHMATSDYYICTRGPLTIGYRTLVSIEATVFLTRMAKRSMTAEIGQATS